MKVSTLDVLTKIEQMNKVASLLLMNNIRKLHMFMHSNSLSYFGIWYIFMVLNVLVCIIFL